MKSINLYFKAFLLIIIFMSSASVFSQSWSSIGGPGSWIYSLCVYNGELIVGTTTGIAKFNGTSWSPLGTGVNGEVDALCVYNGSLYAGGRFTEAGGIPVSFIAEWNGTAWSDPEGGTDSYVVALTVYNNKLIAGGYFTTANIPASHLASWDGHNWAALGSGSGGTQGQVMALTVYNGDLIAAGFFSSAGGVSASRIAKWNGTSWSALGSGINNVVYALSVYQGDLIAGGLFSTAGGISANDVAKWNGSNWAALGSGASSGFYPYVNALAVYGNDLYIGGLYTIAGGLTCNGISKWNGSSYSQLGSGFGSGSNVCGAFALTIYSNSLIAGGIFSSAGGVSAANLAQWGTLTSANPVIKILPKEFKLTQNYPNPFNPSTNIKYFIPSKNFVSLKIFDTKGTDVMTIVNQFKDAGEYDIHLNNTNLSSGVYYYKLTAGDFSETKKMLLLK